MPLDGKVAAITGGNSGIGLATARAFKANGAKVVIFGRDRGTLDQAAASLGDGVLAVQGDVRNLVDLERLFDQTSKRFGMIDILVANAGIAKFAPVDVHRLTRIATDQVEYLAKDTANKQFVLKRYTDAEFVDILIRHAPDGGRHAMRYFGLLSPRSKARVWAGIFVLLKQRVRQHPPRLSCRQLRLRTFGIDPLLDSRGEPMHWIGRRPPLRVG